MRVGFRCPAQRADIATGAVFLLVSETPFRPLSVFTAQPRKLFFPSLPFPCRTDREPTAGFFFHHSEPSDVLHENSLALYFDR